MSYTKRFANADKTLVGVYDADGNCIEYVHVTLERVSQGYLSDVIDDYAEPQPATEDQPKPRKRARSAATKLIQTLHDRLGMTSYKIPDEDK